MKNSFDCLRSAWLLLLTAAVCFNVGCQLLDNPGGGETVPPDASEGASANSDILAAGDHVFITYSGIPIPPQPHNEQIRQDGKIHPPHLEEPVQAAGLTVGKLREMLHNLYVPRIYLKLTLTVKIGERLFTVHGEVKLPGRHKYSGTMTVLDGIAAAHGLSNYAAKRRIQVTRKAEGTVVEFDYNKARGNPKHNLPLYPGDIIYVPRRQI